MLSAVLVLVIACPLALLGVCTVAAVVGTGRTDHIAGQPARPQH